MRSRLPITIITTLTALLLLSCARYEFSVEVSEDGSGAFGVLFALPTGTEQPLAAGDVPEGAEPYLDKDGWHGWTLTIPFSEPGDIALIRAALNPDQQALHDFTLERTTNGWSYEHTIPAFDRLDTTALDFGTDDDIGYYRIRVLLPGDALAHNADRIDADGAFIWDLDVTSTSPIVLMASTDGLTGAGDRTDDSEPADATEAPPEADDDATAETEDGGTNVLVLVLVAVVLLGGMGGGAAFLLRRRGPSPEEDE